MNTITQDELSILSREGCIPDSSYPFMAYEVIERLKEDENHKNNLDTLLKLELNILQDTYRTLYRRKPHDKLPAYNVIICRLYFQHYKW